MSYDAAADVPATVSALFIDGNHSYDSVMSDIRDYVPKVVPDGVILFHDYHNFIEVKNAVDSMCENTKDFQVLYDCDSIRAVRKLN